MPLSDTAHRADPNGRHYIVAADHHGLESARRITTELEARGVDTQVLVLKTEPIPAPWSVGSVGLFSALNGLCSRLDALLCNADMGLRLCLFGTESFIWTLNEVATKHGLRDDQIHREVCGPPSRRVFCVHCRRLMDAVGSVTLTCPGCGRSLAVRDHFSPRLGAYLGVYSDPSRSQELS